MQKYRAEIHGKTHYVKANDAARAAETILERLDGQRKTVDYSWQLNQYDADTRGRNWAAYETQIWRDTHNPYVVHVIENGNRIDIKYLLAPDSVKEHEDKIYQHPDYDRVMKCINIEDLSGNARFLPTYERGLVVCELVH